MITHIHRVAIVKSTSDSSRFWILSYIEVALQTTCMTLSKQVQTQAEVTVWMR